MSRTKRSTAERGYGQQHRRLREEWEQRLDRGQVVVCCRCGRVITSSDRWDLDHHDSDRSKHLGPSHARCNRSAGGRKSARMRRFHARAEAANKVHHPIIPQQIIRERPKALDFFNTRGKR
jgi:hypothetical protein